MKPGKGGRSFKVRLVGVMGRLDLAKRMKHDNNWAVVYWKDVRLLLKRIPKDLKE